ncbi:hypothetical protein Moror_15113 [Moniliophthora roreri MCA 2997]|uniref:Uncharacterized protein n=1 Tax=Moniliophthora roreri (strain MCA 2997) TaxID=1381753 RepID=V2Y568_MONRO|nr:hypothetical protein Moror_15113 [Moniliophthora roreri MCA 2997]
MTNCILYICVSRCIYFTPNTNVHQLQLNATSLLVPNKGTQPHLQFPAQGYESSASDLKGNSSNGAYFINLQAGDGRSIVLGQVYATRDHSTGHPSSVYYLKTRTDMFMCTRLQHRQSRTEHCSDVSILYGELFFSISTACCQRKQMFSDALSSYLSILNPTYKLLKRSALQHMKIRLSFASRLTT